MNALAQSMENLRKGFETLTPVRKMTITVTAFLTLAGIAALVLFAHSIEYRVLFSNLSSEDAGLIVSRLQEKKTPYRLSAGGDTISVPGEKVSELRLEMAASGLPKGGGVGFEIFDTKTLGSTEFEQQLNYRRALQGELSRTINGLDEIQHSRVHIALPKDSLFVSEQRKPTASVTIKLKSGKNLRPAQIEGIAHLVASSVEGLTPECVMIVDSRGSILSRNAADSKLSKLSTSQVEYQRGVEKEMAGRIQSMLESVVGEGKAVVRVAADFNFQVTEKTEETYDAEAPAVRSVRRQSEKTASPKTGDKARSTEAAAGDFEKLDEVINYELNRTVSKTVLPVGEIQKISIAVLVDGTYEKNDKGVEEFKARNKKEMDALEDLVRKSAGFNAARGDQVVMSNIAFKKGEEQDPADQPAWGDRIAAFAPLIKYATVLVIAVLLLFFVIRPLIRLLLTRAPSPADFGMAPQLASGEIQRLPGGASPLVLEAVEDRAVAEADLARQLAKADAKRFAELLRNWLK